MTVVYSGNTVTDLLTLSEGIADAYAGPIVIVGSTYSAITENVIEPLTAIWGADVIKHNPKIGTCTMFGRDVRLITTYGDPSGSRIRGLTIPYAYIEGATALSDTYKATLESRILNTTLSREEYAEKLERAQKEALEIVKEGFKTHFPQLGSN